MRKTYKVLGLCVLYVWNNGGWLAHGMGFRDGSYLLTAHHVFLENANETLDFTARFAFNGLFRHLMNKDPIEFELDDATSSPEKVKSLTGSDLIGVPIPACTFAAAAIKSYHGVYTDSAKGELCVIGRKHSVEGALYEGSDLVMNTGKFNEFGSYTSCTGTYLHNVNTTSSFSWSPMLLKNNNTWYIAGVHLAKTPKVMYNGEAKSLFNVAASNPSLTELRINCGLIRGLPTPARI